MAMDFSGYTKNNDISLNTISVPYYSLQGLFYTPPTGAIHTPIGFDTGIPKQFALSATQTPLSGRYISTFSNRPNFFDRVPDGYSVVAFKITPNVTDCQIAYNCIGSANTAIQGMINGRYYAGVRPLIPPTSAASYLFNSINCGLVSGLEPRRMRLVMPNSAISQSANNTSVPVSEWHNYYRSENWKYATWKQWFTLGAYNTLLQNVCWQYDTSTEFDPSKAGTYSNYASKYVLHSVDDGKFFAGAFAGATTGRTSNFFTVTYNRTTDSVSNSIGDGYSSNLAQVITDTFCGKFAPIRVSYQDFANHFDLSSGDSAVGKILVYFGDKSYHNDSDGSFVDETGTPMSEPSNPDFNTGAYMVRVAQDNSTSIQFSVYPMYHVSAFLNLVASTGIPFMLCGGSTVSAIESKNATYTDFGNWYQTPINSNGMVVGTFRDLSKDPTYFQQIIDPSVIVINPQTADDIDSTPLTVPPMYYIAAGTEVYALTQGQVETTMTGLFNLPASIIETIDKFNNTLGESIKSIIVYPFQIPQYFNTVTGNMVFHGEEIIDTVAKVRQNTCIYDMGGYQVQSTGTFLDYSPYCNYFMYLPYCGFIRLDPRDVVGKELSVKYVIDILTGSCTANIFREGVLIRSESGTIGVHIPVTSRDFTEMANTLLSAGVDSANAAITGVMSMQATGNLYTSGHAKAVPGITGSISTALEVANNLDRLADSSVQQKGNPTTSGAFVLPQYVFIVKVKAKESSYKGYAHEKGVACLKTDNFHNFHGYTVFQNFDTSGIPLLEEELMELKRIMESGVYI